MTRQLTYSRQPGQRMTARRWIIAGVTLAAVLAVPLVVQLNRLLQPRLELRRLQLRCRHFTASPLTAVYNVPSDEPLFMGGFDNGSMSGSVPLARSVTALHRLWAATGRASSLDAATLFLHERTPSGGKPVIVGVTLNVLSLHFPDRASADVVVIELAGLMSTSPPRGTWASQPLGQRPWSAARFYAGQPDPSDPSRFFIRYELNGVSGFIDGQLHADLSVSLTPAIGPPADGPSNKK